MTDAAAASGRAPEPVVTVVVPTRDRARYLGGALDSVLAQELDGAHDVVVVDDGSGDATPEIARRAGVRYLRHERPRGLNAARNTALAETRAELVVFVDDDVQAPAGWLAAIVEGAERHPEAQAFGGPIEARLDGPAPRGCGREGPPITALDLGDRDTETERVWGANLALRRGALELAGPFDEALPLGGDEEEWLERLRAAGGRVFYLAGAGLVHRRAGDDVRLRALMRSAYGRGRSARAHDLRRGASPPLRRELRVLAGCGWHSVRRACPQGLVMGAHAAGRVVGALRPAAGGAGAGEGTSP